jgi:hypothetical protein
LRRFGVPLQYCEPQQCHRHRGRLVCTSRAQTTRAFAGPQMEAARPPVTPTMTTDAPSASMAVDAGPDVIIRQLLDRQAQLREQQAEVQAHLAALLPDKYGTNVKLELAMLGPKLHALQAYCAIQRTFALHSPFSSLDLPGRMPVQPSELEVQVQLHPSSAPAQHLNTEPPQLITRTCSATDRSVPRRSR